MQLDFFAAPVPRATQAPATKNTGLSSAAVTGAGKGLPPAAPGLTVAEMLNLGSKVEFPKNTNAIRVTIGNKTIVILKADADTLKGVGVAQAVEFGTVRNDAKGHPVRKEFEVWATTQSPKNVNDGVGSGGTLILASD